MAESGVSLQRGQTLISDDGLKKMGKELVRLCDGIERHGLVDYEYGVWEEHIVASELAQPERSLALLTAFAVIEECLDLYENNDEPDPGTSSLPNPPSARHPGSR